MESIHGDAELSSEIVALLGRELRSARNENKILLEENTALREEVEVLRGQRTKEQQELSIATSIKDNERVTSNSIPVDYEDLRNQVNQLEKYKEKYLKCREAKHTMQNQCKTLEVEMQTLSEENKKLKTVEHEILQQYQSLAQEVLLLNEKQNTIADSNSDKKYNSYEAIDNFVAGLPAVEDTAPKRAPRTPICHRGVNLKEYLAADNQSLASSSNFLYFSGTLRWYSTNGAYSHSAAFSPTIYFEHTTKRFIEKSPFQLNYGKDVELFYSFKRHIHYAGTYKCHDLRSRIVPTDISLNAIISSIFSTEDSGAPQIKTVKDLYGQGILKVDAIGLQYVGFNNSLFEVLERRFKINNPPEMKRKAGSVEHPLPATIKKPRMTIEKAET